ncbi:MAG: undecaprenyl/decaprenyl-phosphate alpha-N-acetylglucosaminyl 1-phosphate transferase [Victivallales bacterium]|nr:undecaprenyl/decaprenyl-phosphate alpha-N-acetylglucosaminyl 1-phosphate transferase [Victivallales bacterium]
MQLQYDFSLYSMTLVSAFLASLAMTPAAILALLKFNIMDIPDERKIHKKPVPRMGGVAIYAAFAVPLVVFSLFGKISDPEPLIGILLGGGIALLIGCADDIWHVPAILKLVALVALTLLIWRFGVITNMPIDSLIGIDNEILNTSLNLVLTTLWIVGVTSAMNALDHMDSLAGGVSIVASLTYFAVSLQTGQTQWALISLALIGSLAGFLCYNVHPARVFMGDSGSFFLGFSLATIGIFGGWSSNPVKAAIIPVAVLSVPIFDLVYVIVSRRIAGTTSSISESIRYCGKDHIGHRLMDLGFPAPSAAALICFIAATVSISSLTIRHANYLESTLLLIQIIMIFVTLCYAMEVVSIAKARQS